MFNTGQITLPKQWRSRYPTIKKFTAKETQYGLLIQPIQLLSEESFDDPLHDQNIQFFEDEKGMNIKFKKGISAQELLKTIQKHV